MRTLSVAVVMLIAGVLTTFNAGFGTVINRTKGSPTVKYDIKAGVVKYSRSDVQKGVASTTVERLLFDDFGATERYETYDVDAGGNTQLRDVRIATGESQYYFKAGSTRAAWSPYAGNGIAPRFDMREGSPQLKKDEHYKEIASVTIAGVSCDGVSASPTPDGTTLVYGYKHILMKLASDYPSYGNRMTLVALSLDENPTIDSANFQLPEDVKAESGK
jgi:hypothetical protein